MNTKPATFSELIRDWGIAAFAADIGINYSTANAMKQRNAIGRKHWATVLARAPKAGFKIDASDLIAMQQQAEQVAA